MGATRHTVGYLVLVTALILVGGCLGLQGDDLEEASADTDVDRTEWYTDEAQWDTQGDYSSLLGETQGYDVLPVDRLDFEAHDGTSISMAVWRPDVPEDEKVPIIMDSGPYYGDQFYGPLEELSDREESFFVDNFVEDGYAYARMAIRGTAESEGCMEFFGENEQRDIDQAVTEVATQDWSNGNVALYGASYDGTTPWIAAASGNEHVKTIVPISGLTDVAELMYRNGTSEQRGLMMHSIVYWGMIGVPDAATAGHPHEQACPEMLHGTAAGPYTSLTGDRDAANDEAYWQIRDWRDPVKDNYNGSVFLVHGLQDANVEPHMAYPYVNELEDAGIPVKHMLGQWGHDWPDRAERDDDTVRYDWAEMLHRWFEHELREDDSIDTGPAAHVQDNQGAWRTEDTWPPRDAHHEAWNLGDRRLDNDTTEPGSAYLTPAGPETNLGIDDAFTNTRSQLIFQTQTDDELRFAGSPRLHVEATPHSPEGGQLFAQLLDADEGQELARAVMDLRYHEGGHERQQLTPGEPVTAKMEFFPADAVIPEGHTLELRLTADAPDRVPSHALAPIEIHWGDDASQLTLPTIERPNLDPTYPGQP